MVRSAMLRLGVLVALAGVLAIPPMAGSPSPISSTRNPAVASCAPGASIPPSEGSSPAGSWISAELVLRLANASQLDSLVRALAAPIGAPPSRFLTEAEFSARFEPSPGAVASVEARLVDLGARSIELTADRFGLRTVLPQSNLSQLVAAQSHSCGPTWTPSEEFGAFVSAVAVRPAAAPTLTRLVLPDMGPQIVRPLGGHFQFLNESNGRAQLLFGSDVAQAYGASRLFPTTAGGTGTFGSGEAIATLLTSGFNVTRQIDLPPFDPAVVQDYFAATFPSSWPHPTVTGVPVSIAGDTAPLPGGNSSATDDTLAQLENSLDLEMAGSIAPGAALYNYYIPASSYLSNSPTSGPSLADSFGQALAAALAGNYSPARLAVVSNSWGIPEVDDPLWDAELVHAAAIGVTVVASSGDQADAPSLLNGRGVGAAPLWPSTVAFDSSGVLSVGGTSATLSGAATSTFVAGGTLQPAFDPVVRGIASEGGWYDTAGGPGAYSGSEGGISGLFPEPGWQLHSAAQPAIVNATLRAYDWTLGRAVPDLSLPAEHMVMAIGANSSGTRLGIVEGTSVSAPLVAGAIALTSATLGHPLGFLDPALYRIESYYAAHPVHAGDPVRDVVNGSNYLYSAAPGWDAVTGWGSLQVPDLSAALSDPVVANYTYTGPTPGLPPLFPGLGRVFGGGPIDPVLGAIVGGSIALALGVSIAVAMRAEPPVVPAPSRTGSSPAQAAPPPIRPTCPQCGRTLAPWYPGCPWCGHPLP